MSAADYLCVIPITPIGGRFSFGNFFPYNRSVFMKVAALLHRNHNMCRCNTHTA